MAAFVDFVRLWFCKQQCRSQHMSGQTIRRSDLYTYRETT